MAHNIHPDLLAAQKLIYTPAELHYTNLRIELESKEYGACTYSLLDKHIIFRVANITPTKIGQFVTLWKRISNGPIMPYDAADPFDLVVISVRTAKHFGQFVFPKAALREHGIISHTGSGGKRGLRVYPPWDQPDNAQATKTQAWQLKYFLGVGLSKEIAVEKMRALYFGYEA